MIIPNWVKATGAGLAALAGLIWAIATGRRLEQNKTMRAELAAREAADQNRRIVEEKAREIDTKANTDKAQINSDNAVDVLNGLFNPPSD